VEVRRERLDLPTREEVEWLEIAHLARDLAGAPCWIEPRQGRDPRFTARDGAPQTLDADSAGGYAA
jgi:hypothetical protein